MTQYGNISLKYLLKIPPVIRSCFKVLKNPKGKTNPLSKKKTLTQNVPKAKTIKGVPLIHTSQLGSLPPDSSS